MPVERADFRARTPVQNGKLPVPGDFLGKPGAAHTLYAAFTVKDNIVGNRHRFGEMPLFFNVARCRRAVGNGHVLQGALAAPVANRAVQGMICQQKLQNPVLGFFNIRRSGF